MLGEKQEGFARLIGCSIHTLQSIETGRMNLSKSLATRISAQTGVDVDWLLKNNLTSAPVAAASDERYTLETFREAEKSQRIPEFISLLTPDYMFSFYGQLRAILNSAAKGGLAGAAILKTARWLDGLRKQFGHDNSVVPTPDLRLRGDGSPVLTHRQRDGGLGAIRKDVANYDREREKIELAKREAFEAGYKTLAPSATSVDNSKHKRFIRERKKMLSVLDERFRRARTKIIREWKATLKPTAVKRTKKSSSSRQRGSRSRSGTKSESRSRSRPGARGRSQR